MSNHGERGWHVVRFSKQAQRELLRLPRRESVRIAKRVALLARDPSPHDATKLAATRGPWRIRVGDYRAIYRVIDAELLVLVVGVGHRSSVYRDP